MLNVAFGEFGLSSAQVQLRYNRFEECREVINNDDRPSRLSTSTIVENLKAVKKMILDNRQIFISEVADDVGILFESNQ